MWFQVHFMLSHRLKGKRSLRRRQRLPLHSIELFILRRRSASLSNLGIIFTHMLFTIGGESSKGLIFHSSIRFWRFMPKGEKVLAQSKRTTPPPICLVHQRSNGYTAPTIVCKEQLMRYSARRSQSSARRCTGQ
jgi:hypothetical protein